MSAFDALYMRRVRALLRFIVVVVVVVVVRVVGASVGAFSRARRRRRAAHRVVDDRAHTHKPRDRRRRRRFTSLGGIETQPSHSRNRAQTFIHSLQPPGAVVRALD